MKNIFLSLGSNVGDRELNLESALLLIQTQIGVIEKKSSPYETEAWGNKNQSPFINLVVKVESSLTAFEILNLIQKIELKLGRVRKEKWEAREIDIDILYFGDQIINNELLIVPHPLLYQRKFVLVPLTEIANNFEHPVLHKTNLALLRECLDVSEVKLV